MLVRFSFQNYRSFRDRNELLMIASDKITNNQKHVFSNCDPSLLQAGIIFGANAGGKSNFVKAIEFASELVLNGRINVTTEHCFLIDDTPNPIGVFQFDLLIKDKRYSYTLALNYQTSSIESESLFRIEQGKDDFCLFERGLNEQNELEFNSDFILSNNVSLSSKFNTYKDDYTNSKLARTLFLSDIVNRIPKDCPELLDFNEVFNWFNRMIILSPSSSIIASPRVLESEDDKKFLESNLSAFDTGITSLSKIDVDLDAALSALPKGIALELKERVNQQLLNENQIVSIRLDSIGTLLEVHKVNGSIMASKILSVHKNENHPFEFKDESDGTKRLFGLLPIYRIAEPDSLIIVDELDRSLHTKAVVKFIQMLYKISKTRNSQFIVTTHDDGLLSLDCIRDDEVWFVDRDKKDNSSSIFSLDYFKNRPNGIRRESYLDGRYRAVPFINDELLFDEED